MTSPVWEDSEFYPVEQEWALLAARLGLSLFALNGVEFVPDLSADGEVQVRCACQDAFGCTAIGKHPKYKGYLDSGTQGEREARMLVFAGPRNGFGVLTGTTSGVLVVDVDARNGGYASLEAVEAVRGTLPATLRVLSGSGDGFHLYYGLPRGRVAVNDSAGKVLGAGLDIKGDGGMVVWPPSLHRSGRRYGLDASAPVEIAALPEDLVPLVTKPKAKTPGRQAQVAVHALTTRQPQRYARAAFERTVERIQRQQSERNNALNDAAFALGQLGNGTSLVESAKITVVLGRTLRATGITAMLLLSACSDGGSQGSTAPATKAEFSTPSGPAHADDTCSPEAVRSTVETFLQDAQTSPDGAVERYIAPEPLLGLPRVRVVLSRRPTR